MDLIKNSYILFGFLLTLVFSSGCSKHETSFTEIPAFKEHFANNKPSETLPSNIEQTLLSKYRPRIFMAKGQTSMIDFYADYVDNGSLYLDGKFISDKVTQSLLNEHKDNVQAEFRYKPRHKSIQQQGVPAVYARIHKDDLTYKDQRLPLTFLSYNLVFANSGLLKGIAGWQ